MVLLRRRASLVLALLLLVLPATPLAGEEDASPLASPIRAVLLDVDAGLERGVYDGIREGLEDAKLPRIRQEPPFGTGEGGAAILARLEADPPPLLFVLGPTAGALLAGKLPDVPRVFVDTAWYVNGEEYPPPPVPRGRAAVVRAVVNGSRVAEVIRRIGLASPRPVGELSWPATTPALSLAASRLATAVGFEPVTEETTADLLLHLRLRVGEKPADLAALVRRAREQQIPLLSDDIAHWQRGAAVVVLPDFRLLGRMAANMGRQFLALDENPPARMTMSVSEVHIDIRAARAEGLEVPLRCLAWADLLRRGPVRWPEEEATR